MSGLKPVPGLQVRGRTQKLSRNVAANVDRLFRESNELQTSRVASWTGENYWLLAGPLWKCGLAPSLDRQEVKV
jgi:hypothetical protein